MELAEIQKWALGLPDSDRAVLAAELLVSLPAVLVDPDDGMAEAVRRAKELDADPLMECSWEDIKQSLGR